ncbi:RNA polymerase sigma-70 factor, ECF subfamily [Mucilaginibacter pineti]|uniref:RNA polymerase sigma-70 factor, ECF subfamily n=1 Tax=Mucilaginibacter pineti TaxID=1391627 RepID=A0A1G7EHY1_9SPHI|nr:RNA polymerase sigma-70 factor [Mucilaginibacter pineti]SDE63274.1 RNA polymerase sigma-70 factor, ECF subfamily [Mucilaginibacter pineti]
MAVYKNSSDAERVALLKGDDQAAFTEIYRRYWSLIYAHVYKMLRDRPAAEDAVQEIFSSLWLKRQGLKDAANLKGYLYVNARNRVFNLIEQQKTRQNYLGAIAKYLNEEDLATLTLIDEKECAELLDRELAALPPKMREIFELSRKSDLSHKEIAERLDISEHTVKKQVQNALKVLKPRLHDAGLSIAIILFMR